MTRAPLCYFLLPALLAAQRYEFPPLTAKKQGVTDKSQGEAIGTHRSLSASAMRKGRWTKLAGGRRLWRLAIYSPKAVGLRVRFAKFAAGAGKVSLHGGGEIAGPYTGTGIDRTGSFWTDTVFADTVTVEYEAPPNTPSAAGPPFQIVEIAHLFR